MKKERTVNLTLGQKLIRTKPTERSAGKGSADGHAAPAGEPGRSIGLFPLTMIGVGATIGTGISFTMVEAVPSVILSSMMAAATAGLTALCCAELSFRIPAAGSSYSFAYATVGEFAAFIMAFCLLLEYGLAASATAIRLVMARASLRKRPMPSSRTNPDTGILFIDASVAASATNPTPQRHPAKAHDGAETTMTNIAQVA